MTGAVRSDSSPLTAAAGLLRASMTLSASTKPETLLGRGTMLLPQYRVLLHNDDKNTMEHVVRALMRVFRYEQAECERIMLEAHRNGLALCAVEPLEQAELHRDQLISASLISTIEPA